MMDVYVASMMAYAEKENNFKRIAAMPDRETVKRLLAWKKEMEADKSPEIIREARIDSLSNWMFWAHLVLVKVSIAQDTDGAHNLNEADQFHSEFPDHLTMLKILTHEGYIRYVDVPKGAYPYRITLKGLALRSALEDIAPCLDPTKVENENTASINKLVTDRAIKLLAAMHGLAAGGN